MLEKYPERIQRIVHAPLVDARLCVEHGSDTAAGLHARYVAHKNLRVVLVMAAGLREIERPIKYWLQRLEKRGMKKNPFIDHMRPSPAELMDQHIEHILSKAPMVPPNEEYRVTALFALRKLDTYLSEHWCFPDNKQQRLLQRFNALYLAYLPEAGSA